MPAALDVRLLRAAVFAAACCVLATTGHLLAAGSGVEPWKVAVGWLVLFVCCVPLAGRQRRSLPAVTAVVAATQVGLHVLFSLGHSAAAAHASGAPTQAAGTSPAAGHAAHAGAGTAATSAATGAADAANGAAAASGAGSSGAESTMELAARLLCNDHAAGLSLVDAERLIREAGLRPPPVPDDSFAAAAVGPAAGLLGELLAALLSLAAPSMLAGHLLAALCAGWLLLRGEAALWSLIRLSAPLVAALPAALRLAVAVARLLAGPRPGPPAAVRPSGSGHHPTAATCGTVLADTVIRRGPPAGRAQLTLAA
ncbi:hypothetical protein [Streptomyces otsuchiensis]|uniref:hypothetical protein n=1 Tax=Streptomyces otsuchiensis TaxID=2681388 RepID=UPI0010325907|nr:hypothetical protein [Streptomyces otsuchiensis]